MPKICLLDKEIAELIAAGEVIERPCSVVKELLENSIDSGATSITVEMKQGGITFLRISDNGCGISYEDVPTAFLRHATSKIRLKSDLESIYTLGFRGEALASVAAVSKVEILTRTGDGRYGTHYVIEGTEEKLYEQAGCPVGTTVIVRDLFFNVPARLKFMKKDVYEGNAIAEIVSRVALSHPEISFKLIRDNRQEIFTPGDGDLYTAIYAVLGRQFAASLIEVDYKMNGVKVSGFTVKPIMGRVNRRLQMFYVNGRYVRSYACMDALEEAYANSMMTGKFPSCVLKLEMDATVLDVNVHPAKTEIRFTNEKPVRDAVFFAVKNTLLANTQPNEFNIPQPKVDYTAPVYDNTTPEQISFAEDEKHEETNVKPYSFTREEAPAVSASAESVITKEKIMQAVDDEIEQAASASLDESFKKLTAPEDTDSGFKYISKQSFAVKQPQVIIEDKPAPTVIKDSTEVKYIGEVFKNYIVGEAADGLLLVDKHAAHERIIYEEIKASNGIHEAQMLLEPVSVLLDYDEYSAACANIGLLSELGFAVTAVPPRSIEVSGVPTIVDGADVCDIIVETVRNLVSGRNNPMPEMVDNIYHTIACKAAIKANDKNSPTELKQLLEKVYNNEKIRYCPHGRPCIFRLTKHELEKQFKRIQ